MSNHVYMGTVYIILLAIVYTCGFSLQPRLVVGYLYRYPEYQSVVFEVLSVLVSIVIEVSVGDVLRVAISSPSIIIHHFLTGHSICWE